MKIFELRDTPNRNVFYYDADKYDGNYREQIEEYLVKSIDALLQSQTRSYCIAYLHSSFIEFLIFRRIMEKWPEHFYARMRKVYIVGATVMVRIIESLSFGTFSRLL